MSEVVEDPPSKTEAILAAGLRLFTQFGYRRTAMDDIAREAGVAKGTLYLYFSGKRAVFRAMQARNLAEVEALAEAGAMGDGTFQQRLFAVLDALYGTLHERYGQSEYLTELASTGLEVGPDIARQASEAYARRLGAVMEAALQAGEIALPEGLDRDDMIAALQAGARGAKHLESAPVSPDGYRAGLRRLAALIAAALRPR